MGDWERTVDDAKKLPLSLFMVTISYYARFVFFFSGDFVLATGLSVARERVVSTLAMPLCFRQ